MEHEQRKEALRRAEQLKETIHDYEAALPAIPTGFQQWPRILQNQERIRSFLGATDRDWQNWRWHLKHRVTTTELLKRYLPLSPQQVAEIDRTGELYRWAVSP